MSDNKKPNEPWMVAVWPGMGSVALSAGYYLMSKLGMTAIAEYSSDELFDVDHVNVEAGLITTAVRPRSRLFLWKDPQDRHDIVVFIGEAQPPRGKYAFCNDLIDQAEELEVQRVFTFASMATRMHPQNDPRIFGAATDGEGLRELQRLKIAPMSEGQIGGLNGVLLGAAAEAGMQGFCLLGEIPHVFAQVPFPKASLSVLEVFATMAGIDVDFSELRDSAELMQKKLGEVLSQVEHIIHDEAPLEEEVITPETTNGAGLSPEEKDEINTLFIAAEQDRSRAFELKQLLDELNAFREYEDRFLDLFQEPNGEKDTNT